MTRSRKRPVKAIALLRPFLLSIVLAAIPSTASEGTRHRSLLAELAAAVKAQGQTLHQKLDALYWQFGYHGERLFTQAMPGSEGMRRIKKVMAAFRDRPPRQLAGLPVSCVRDYLKQSSTVPGGSPEPLAGPRGDMIILDLAAEGNYVAVRPSGTEPKVKFYMFTYQPAELIADLDDTRDEMICRLENLQHDLAAFVEFV